MSYFFSFTTATQKVDKVPERQKMSTIFLKSKDFPSKLSIFSMVYNALDKHRILYRPNQVTSGIWM